ncbi:hypothetical protein L3Q82_010166 [Scortum barcoo]|uniref:Uncharacterized protein n=1 Tax=Scortum barcoo TaxID=214431 RepID=A0ACB8WD45_9TELE|nr:hypothetical protein L3Q82_010166 [Scortum barcoo]
MNFSPTAAVYLLIITRYLVGSTHPECSIVLHLQKKENECKLKMKSSNTSAGCLMEWDGVSCWPAASEGEIVSVRCPPPLLKPESPSVLVTRSCSGRGWSEPSMPYHEACFYEAPEEDDDMKEEKNYFDTLKLIYSVGHGASLAALLIAALVFCCFRKLLCTRNYYIHLHLFVSFMLRSLAVFVKDSVLFADKSMDHCTASTLRCKAAVTFLHFCVLSNFCWLLVEGLYLQTLLLFSFVQTRKLLWIYASVGWGTLNSVLGQPGEPLVVDNQDSCSALYLYELCDLPEHQQDHRSEDKGRTRGPKRDTNLQETRSLHSPPHPSVRPSLHVVFALIPEHVVVGPRLYFELVLGSFQGFIVALLYCFLNGEVRKEIQRTMRRFWPETKTNVINLPTQECVP